MPSSMAAGFVFSAAAAMDVGKLEKRLMRNRIIIFLVIILVIGFLLHAATVRPPVLDPNDVPFAYDPNKCLSEPLEWIQVAPGSLCTGDLHATDDDGDDVFFALLSGPSGVLITKGISIPDANDPNAMVHYMTWSWPVPMAMAVEYII